MAKITISDAEILLPGFLDFTNARSLVNISPIEIRDFVRELDPKTFTKPDKRLLAEAKPDLTAKCLRINFWAEYIRAQDNNDDMKLALILKGVTTREYFLHLAETNPEQLAWIIVPPKDFAILQEQIFRDGLDKLRKLISLDPYDTSTKTTTNDKGTSVTTSKKLNPGYVAEVRKTVEMLAGRLLGSVTKNVNVMGKITHVKEEDKPQLLSIQEIDAIDAELDSLG